MTKKDALIKEIYQIIFNNLGEFAAECYKEFYSERSIEEILLSTEGLLVELVGPQNAQKQLKEICKEFKTNEKKYV